MIFDLAKDFSAALAAMLEEHPKRRMLELLEEAIRRDIQPPTPLLTRGCGGPGFIARHPTTLFQFMWNTCWWYDYLEPKLPLPIPTRRVYGCSPRVVLRRPVNELRKRDIPQGVQLFGRRVGPA
jgi:hypothetical protein